MVSPIHSRIYENIKPNKKSRRSKVLKNFLLKKLTIALDVPKNNVTITIEDQYIYTSSKIKCNFNLDQVIINLTY